jgi:purine-binding chemotaxis protein CheW
MKTESKTEAAAGTELASEVDSRQFVTFLVNDELFGVPMGSVHEIIRMPSVVHVPLSPPSLEGLANLRGRVLPIIDLRAAFQLDRVAHNEATRVIVTDCGALVGFVVDRVASVVSVDCDRIESAQSIDSTVDVSLITGLIKDLSHGGRDRMAVLLDLARVLAQEFSALSSARAAGAAHGTGGLAAHDGAGNDNAAASELQLVSFQVAEQEYAFPIQCVQEIVQVPSGFCQIPNAGPHVLGVMTLRDRLLPIVSLREMFKLPRAALEEHNRIVVLAIDGAGSDDGALVGIVMDRVKEVLRLPASSVGPLPGLLARDERIREVDAICRLDGGKRLVSVLSVERMFEHEALVEAKLVASADEASPKESTSRGGFVAQSDEEEQMVVFRLGDEEYGVAIDDVQEILRVADQFTHVPKSASFIEGLVSLRGAVLPVVDLRRRFGLAAKHRDERQRVMVFSVGGVRTGVIVDAVTEVLKVPHASFEGAPTLSEEQAQMIRRVANMEKQKRMILVLEAGQLFSDEERAELSAVA